MATTITVYEDVNDVGVVESGTTITVYEMFIGVGPQGPTGATGPAGASAVAGVLPSSFVEMTTPVTVTSATLVDITGATTTITLDSTVNIAVFMDCEISSDGVCDLGLAISINGTDHDVVTTHLFGTVSDPGKTSVVHRTTTPLAAGTYTVKGRFLRSSGTKTPQVDRADLLVFGLQGAKGTDGVDGVDGITPDAIHAATNKTTPVDADEVGIWDSVTGLLNRLSWANIKATLKTYFDALFAPITGSAEYIAAVTPGTAGNVLTSNGTTWESAAAAGGGGAVTNLLINGGFDFFQRIAPATATAMTDDVYNAPDRWYSLVQGANATINRDAGIGTSKYSCKLVAGGTTNRYGIAQIKESAESIPLRGKEVIAQCLVKPVNNAGSGTRKYRIAILEWTGTADAVTSELVADWASGTFTTAGFFASTTKTLVATASVTATHNTETQLSCTGTVSTSCNNLIVFIWTEDVPTHASDYVLIGEAGLYTSGAVQEWNPAPIAEEFLKCARYCYVLMGALYTSLAIGLTQSTTAAALWVTCPTSMFKTPDLTIAGSVGMSPAIGGTYSSSSIDTAKISNSLCQIPIAVVVSGATAGVTCLLETNNSAAAYLKLDAEL